MLIEKGKKYTTLEKVEIDLDQLDDEEMKFLRHLERRSMLDGLAYLDYMQAVTVWKHPAYKDRKPAEIAECPVYKIAEDLGLRLGVRTGEFADEDVPVPSEEELLDMMVPEGIVSRFNLYRVKRKVRKKRKQEDRELKKNDKE